MALNGLPKVTIDYGNGALGQTISSADGLLCLVVCGAKSVAGSFSPNKAYSIRKLRDLEALGITGGNNPLLYQTVRDFYAEARDGTRVYIAGYPDTLKMSDVLNKNNPYLRNIIDATNGELRGFAVTAVADGEPDITDGLNADIPAAMLNAQALGEWARTARYAPVFFILDGLNYTGNASELKDLKKYSYYRTAVVIGSVTGMANQAVGPVAGRIASASVDRNIGRVADGALNVLSMYAGYTAVESADTETVYDKSYITFRTFTGISGYFIADDLTAAGETDDYNRLTAVRTVDKAARIAYTVLVQQLLDKVRVKTDGTMQKPVIVAWQRIIENALAGNMTANGELSDDGGDNGVRVYIDPAQDVLATGTINVEIRVRPFGYARYIKVLLGFTINEN